MDGVKPEVYLVGYTALNMPGLCDYLNTSGNNDFHESITEAWDQQCSEGEVLVSMMAKLCYASLTLGKNANVSRVRDIPDNLKGTLASGHGSVWEHASLNFIIRNCSRVMTHEIVRHRVGVAFPQTSGRYVRTDRLDLVIDPILAPIMEEIETTRQMIHERYNAMVARLDLDSIKDFTVKKKLTSALRRLLPNGQANEIGFTANLRTLRHLVQLRTSRQAEWEIRFVFGQIYRLTKEFCPILFHDAREEEVDGLLEVAGMKTQPYEASAGA